jgi:hypothetical protein
MTRIGIRIAVKNIGAASLLLSVAMAAEAADKTPDILGVWGDDVGRDNIWVFVPVQQKPKAFLETLDEEPIVFQVPDFGGRFWVHAPYDARGPSRR